MATCDTNWKDIYGEVCKVTAQTSMPDSEQPGFNKVKFTFTDAYPCLTIIMIFDIYCDGSIPIAVCDYELMDDWDSGLVAPIVNQGWYSDPDNLIPASPEQIDPGNRLFYWWAIHIDQESEQNIMDEMSFKVTLCNWNMGPVPNPFMADIEHKPWDVSVGPVFDISDFYLAVSGS